MAAAAAAVSSAGAAGAAVASASAASAGDSGAGKAATEVATGGAGAFDGGPDDFDEGGGVDEVDAAVFACGGATLLVGEPPPLPLRPSAVAMASLLRAAVRCTFDGSFIDFEDEEEAEEQERERERELRERERELRERGRDEDDAEDDEYADEGDSAGATSSDDDLA
jgi:hypothetical protein